MYDSNNQLPMNHIITKKRKDREGTVYPKIREVPVLQPFLEK